MKNAAKLEKDNHVGRLFFIGIPGPEIDKDTENLLREIKPGGICLFARNIRSAEQTRNLTDSLRELLGDNLLISIDQEGGLVDRLRRILEPMPAAGSIKSAEQATRHGQLIGRALRLLGINVDFAPVVDVIDNERSSASNGLYSRNFGTSAQETTDLAKAFLAGLEVNGIIGCLKHFPGLGASRIDSHEDLPVVDIDLQTLFRKDLYPYTQLLGSGHRFMIMTAHCAYPKAGLKPDNPEGEILPASLNPNVIGGLLRDEIGFTGVSITDDLEMGAITRNFGIGDACVRAVLAGQDMVAICAGTSAIRKGFQAVIESLENGVIAKNRLAESLTRIDNLSAQVARPMEFTLSAFSEISEEIRQFKSEL